MENFAYFSDSFNIAKTTTYQLSLLLKGCGISYTITDTVRNKCLAIKNFNFENADNTEKYHANIQSFIDDDSFLSKNYKRTNFIYSSHKSTLVPYDFFNKSILKEYFTMNFEMDELEEIHFNKLPELKLVNVFSIPSEITTLMVNKFPELRFYHQSTTLIDGLAKKSRKKGYMIGVLVCGKYFDIAVTHNGELLLSNNIRFSNEQDFVYHIMNIYKQLNIPNRETHLYLGGDITKESKLFRLLSEYVSNIWFSKAGTSKPIIYNFREVPQHMVANILSIA